MIMTVIGTNYNEYTKIIDELNDNRSREYLKKHVLSWVCVLYFKISTLNIYIYLYI